jgi:hypothetical protein
MSNFKVVVNTCNNTRSDPIDIPKNPNHEHYSRYSSICSQLSLIETPETFERIPIQFYIEALDVNLR